MKKTLFFVCLFSILAYGVLAVASPSDPPTDSQQTQCLYAWDRCKADCVARYTEEWILCACVDQCDMAFEECYL
ncbi:MAG: hypothetical protein QNK37_03980 [Acidobacteriota bacterium]|nr:hypothetical protein [Acidobacteriota bacterium]